MGLCEPRLEQQEIMVLDTESSHELCFKAGSCPSGATRMELLYLHNLVCRCTLKVCPIFVLGIDMLVRETKAIRMRPAHTDSA